MHAAQLHLTVPTGFLIGSKHLGEGLPELQGNPLSHDTLGVNCVNEGINGSF
jgi:hypothetical protein